MRRPNRMAVEGQHHAPQITLGAVGLGALLIAVAAALTLAPQWGQMVAARSDPRKPIEVWSWNIAAMALERLVPSFEAMHPDVRVHINRNGTNMQSRLLLSLAANV